ncbi:MAG TPA: sterol desaturase family protein [Thermoanaerobaculia bacterium]|nr:sterol desaturase family protein [Thermoanaerobaculia bacterium]
MLPDATPITVLAQRLISTAVVGGTFLIALISETIRPLRGSVEPKFQRIVRNLTTGGISLAVLTFLQAPLLIPAAQWAAERRIGLLNLIELPHSVEIAIAIVLFDYTLWIWHWASHVVPFLWRFHLVHHVDRDLDASTALRFHFGELVLSVGYRTIQIIVIGADPFSVWVWQTILFVSILFHHSNLRLPVSLERWLVRFIVTPRMHGIHHSAVRNETNSNWSSILSWWDYLHRTMRLDVPHDSITIGVPAYLDPRDVTIGRILALPFVRQRDDWRREDGVGDRPPAGPPLTLAE